MTPEEVAQQVAQARAAAADIIARLEKIRDSVTGQPQTLQGKASRLRPRVQDLRAAWDVVISRKQSLAKTWQGDDQRAFQPRLEALAAALDQAMRNLDNEIKWLDRCAYRLTETRANVVGVILRFTAQAQRLINEVACGRRINWMVWGDAAMKAVIEATRLQERLSAFLAGNEVNRTGTPAPPTWADNDLPFAERISRTQQQIAEYIEDGERRLAGQSGVREDLERRRVELAERVENQVQDSLTPDTALRMSDLAHVERQLAGFRETEKGIEQAKSLQGRQILYFDPTGDGALVELRGKIDDQTKNIAIFVPGMDVNMAGSAVTGAERADSFVNKSGGDLAVVVALLGDHPNGVSAAVSPAAAQELGGPLADLSHAVRAEAVAAGAADAKLTTVAHSYAASILGEAERAGLSTDRIVYLAGAGVGHGVAVPEDLRNINPNVARYSLTAPYDPVELPQNLGDWGTWNHGQADPDSFGGVTGLETGYYPPGQDGSRDLLWGLSAHSDVWTPNSDAWNNIYGVITSGEVQPLEGPRIDIDDLENQRRSR